MGIISGIMNSVCCEAMCFASDVIPDLNTSTRSSDRFAAPSFNVNLLDVDFGDLEGRYLSRACDGYIVAVHVISYLNGEEGLRGDWNCDPAMQKAANALSKALGFCTIYKNVADDTEFGDLDVNNTGNPIITKDILSKVMDDYHLNDEVIKSSRFYDKESDSIIIDLNIPEPDDDALAVISIAEEVPFDDSSVEVMDIEEDVIKARKKENNKEEQKPVRSPIVDEHGQKFLNISNEVQELTEHQKKTFDELFGKYLNGKKYELHRMRTGSIECVIQDQGGIYSRWIDPGLVVGDGWNVLGNVFVGFQGFGAGTYNGVDTIPVNYRDDDICERVFQNGDYILSPVEVKACNNRLFDNQVIYSIFDMSTMNARIEKMSKEEFSKFGDTLTKIINSLKPEQIGRFRFYGWKDPNHFKVISDQKVMSPFPGPTRYNITDVEVTVNGDQITVKDGTEERSSSLKETAA